MEKIYSFKNELPEETKFIMAIRKEDAMILLFDNPTQKMQMAAVRRNPSAAQYIQYPTQKVQTFLLSRSPYHIKYIHNASEGTIMKFLEIMKAEPNKSERRKMKECFEKSEASEFLSNEIKLFMELIEI